MNIRMAVLDIGGTTVHEEGAVLGAFHDALVDVGHLDDLDDAMKTVTTTMGMSKIEVFRMILDDEDEAGRANTAFEHAIEERITEGEMLPMPGAIEAIDWLKGQGIAVVIATGFAPSSRDRLLAHLGWSDVPDLAASPGGRLRGRPYPDVILDALITLGVDDVRQVAVVGDTANDLLAGHRAGAGIVAGVLTGSHGRSQLEAAPHTHILDSIAQLQAVIESSS
ncbi:MAG: HAD family hydrolase [Acidimicrobiia bacterium]